MNKLKKFISVNLAAIAGLLVVSVATAPPAHALFENSVKQACNGATLTNGGNCDAGKAANKVSGTLSNIIDILTIIVGIAAVISIIINGLKFITSNGDSNSISSAKNGIIYALVGLVIVALAQVIVKFIINRVD